MQRAQAVVGRDVVVLNEVVKHGDKVELRFVIGKALTKSHHLQSLPWLLSR